ncbi:hypothetical protein [Borreliella andersonii]|uniref:hypothetical protein n=1 Tax=Borrelia andersonii TaxID=42109 RepID=UPI003AB55A83
MHRISTYKKEIFFIITKTFAKKISECFDNNDEIDVLLFKIYCLGYSYTISSTKSTETLKTTCGSISAIGKVPEQTVEFSGYSVRETSTNKKELLERYIEKSHFIALDVSKKIVVAVVNVNTKLENKVYPKILSLQYFL